MKVFIVGGGRAYEQMFLSRGWETVDSPQEADLLQFTGGEDVSPGLYGENSHRTTHSNSERDRGEVFLFQDFAGKTPMAGICRGAQFLNVLNGGTLYQDVNNHAIGDTHAIIAEGKDRVIQVTSTHHQMMRPHKDAAVLAIANRATRKEYVRGHLSVIDGEGDDVEVVLYKKTRSLCFQPHPEFERAPKECTDYYFELIDQLMEMKA